MARLESSKSWGVLLIGLLIGLVVGIFATEYGVLEIVGIQGPQRLSGSNRNGVCATCQICPACEPVALFPQPFITGCHLCCKASEVKPELSCKAPAGWLKKPAPKKPKTAAKEVAPALPQAPSAPAAVAEKLAPAVPPPAKQQQPALMPLGEIPKVNGCINPNQQSKEKQKC